MILSIIPVTLGAGLPLFPRQGQREKSFELLEAKGYGSGLVQVSYRRKQVSVSSNQSILGLNFSGM